MHFDIEVDFGRTTSSASTRYDTDNLDFVPCAESTDSCTFYIAFSTGLIEESCSAHCAKVGGTCSSSRDELSQFGPDRCDTNPQWLLDDCDEEYSSVICTCSKPAS